MQYMIFKGYQLLYNLIQNGLFDVNPDRRATSGRFVYPTFPTGLDDAYPRVTIKLTSIEPASVGAGNIVSHSADGRISGFQAALTYRIIVFIKKETEYPVEIDGSAVKAKNELLLEHMTQDVLRLLLRKMVDGTVSEPCFWVNSMKDVFVTPGTWEFDTHRIATEINIRLNAIEEINTTNDGSGGTNGSGDTLVPIEEINYLVNANL